MRVPLEAAPGWHCAAVSLHVYAPALREMTRYTIDDGILNVAVVEKAGVNW